MRTNIDIDDDLMEQALRAGPYKTKKDAVEAGLRLVARQAAYREILKWEGKLKWEGDESIDWTRPPASEAPAADAPASEMPAESTAETRSEPVAKATAIRAIARYASPVPATAPIAAEPHRGKSRARR